MTLTPTSPASLAPDPAGSAPPAAAEEDLASLTRPDFPLLAQTACLGQPLIYLDYAATSQKPRQVLAALQQYYGHDNANEQFEAARSAVARFVGAADGREIVYTRNASEAINLVARTWGEVNLRPGDEVLLTVMEHHSNLVPWQLLAARTGCVLRHVGLTPSGELDLEDLRAKLTERTRLVSLVQVSNALGCLNPIAEITPLAHASGALVLVDACQSLPHMPVDVKQLGCDFLVGSSHKFCGPTGMGFLWGHEALLEAMPPFLGGGEMIQDVFLDHSSWADLPHKFEAGTPAIGEAIGMGAAIAYLQTLGMERIHAWEQRLTRHLFERLQAIEGLHILGPTPEQQHWRPFMWRACTPTTSRPCSIPPASASAAVTIAPSRCIATTASVPQRGPASVLPPPSRRSIASLRNCRARFSFCVNTAE